MVFPSVFEIPIFSSRAKLSNILDQITLLISNVQRYSASGRKVCFLSSGPFRKFQKITPRSSDFYSDIKNLAFYTRSSRH